MGHYQTIRGDSGFCVRVALRARTPEPDIRHSSKTFQGNIMPAKAGIKRWGRNLQGFDNCYCRSLRDLQHRWSPASAGVTTSEPCVWLLVQVQTRTSAAHEMTLLPIYPVCIHLIIPPVDGWATGRLSPTK